MKDTTPKQEPVLSPFHTMKITSMTQEEKLQEIARVEAYLKALYAETRKQAYKGYK